MKYILAHDLGTTGNKATLYNQQGEMTASVFSGYETRHLGDNRVEQNPEDWWQAVQESTAQLISTSGISRDDVAVISFSGQMMGCVPVDQEARAIRNAIIWADQRSTAEEEEMIAEIGADRGYKITGHRLSASYSAAKIKWLMNNEKQIYDKTYKFLQAKDYIIARLTGVFATDYSDASGTNLLDLEKLQWSQKIVEALGINHQKLPELKESTAVAGELLKPAAEALDLPAGIPVVMGAGDGMTASVGAGSIAPGTAYNYLGSSSWIALAAEEPVFDPEKRTFNWAHAVPGMYVPCGSMQSAGASYAWLRDNIAWLEHQTAAELDFEAYDLMNIRVSQSQPGAGKLLFLPYLMGERSPHWNPEARGAFLGLSMNNDRADLMRAVMEGVTFNLRIILDSFENELEFDEIRVIGGGAESSIWREIMANIYHKKILKLKILREAPSLGAAIIGGIAADIFPDFSVAEKLNPVIDMVEVTPEVADTYQEIYPVFKESYQALTDIYTRLKNIKI